MNEAKTNHMMVYCPVCRADKLIEFIGPFTLTAQCGVMTFFGKPDPDSEINVVWYSFTHHTPSVPNLLGKAR